MTTPRRFGFCLLFVPGLLLAQAVPPPAVPAANERSVSINYPRTSVFEVLSLYESLTGKRIIRDSNLAGPDLSIMVAELVSKSEAISLIESSLLLNGYSLIPSGDGTVKILGPSRPPRTEGLPLYTNEANLPANGDQLAIFFKPLRFITPEEALPVIQGVIQINSYGSLVPVPNANAIVITDKTPVIRKALALIELIDLQPAQVVTEFITLKRANATKVVEILDEMFGDEEKTIKSTAAPPANVPPPPEGAVASEAPAQFENRLIAGRARFLADKRTNRILVVARRESYRYVRDVISQLDAAGGFEEPYVQQLNYMPVADVFPVLADMLKERDDETQVPTSTGNQPNTQQPQNNSSSGNFGNNNSNGLGGSGGSGSLDRPDSLSDSALQSAPLSVSLGEIRIIADNSENSIIVYGPPEAKERARQILGLLDRRPKQVYLAVVIGQLRVGDGLDYGVSYLVKYQNFNPLGSSSSNSNGGAAAVLSPRLFPGVDVLPDPSKLVSPETFATLSGLTIYGTIAESVDVFARFLETSNRFRTLSRPVVYTTNNRKATILSGQRVPVPTSTLTQATGNNVIGDNAAITSNIQYQDVVLKLEVLPLINSDREVNLVIAQTNDNIIGSDTISGNQVPRIATQKITTSVRVPNGATIVLGGLISEDTESNKEGIPYVSRIPVLGTLLGGSTNKEKERRELIVMIQPVVVDDNAEMMKASAKESDRTPLGTDGMAQTAPVPDVIRRPPGPVIWPTPTPRKKSWFPFFQKNDKSD